MNKSALTKSTVVCFLAVFCNLLWGSAYPGVKIGYEAFSVNTVPETIFFAGLRFTAAGLIVTLFGMAKNKSLPKIPAKSIPLMAAVSLVYTTLQYVFFYIGLSNTSGTNGSIFNSTTTFMAVILSHFVYKNDKITKRKLAGCAIGFAGVLAATASGIESISFKGEGFIVLGALMFVIGSMLSKKATESIDSFYITGLNLFFGGAVLIAIGAIGGGVFTAFTAQGMGALAYLCFLSVCAYTIWTVLLKYNPVGKISVFNFIIPVSAAVLSAIFLDEDIFQLKYLVSLLLVCTGIIVVNKDTVK